MYITCCCNTHSNSAVEQFIRAKYERKQYISRDGDRSKATAAEQDQRPKVKKTVEKKAPPPITTPKNQVTMVGII